jgi:hypothetical protein
MDVRSGRATIGKVRDADRIKRYTLVARSPLDGKPDRVRRFSLARVGDTPRSASGSGRLDRLERMERIVEAERDPPGDGGDPLGDQDMRS